MFAELVVDEAEFDDVAGVGFSTLAACTPDPPVLSFCLACRLLEDRTLLCEWLLVPLFMRRRLGVNAFFLLVVVVFLRPFGSDLDSMGRFSGEGDS